MTKRKITVRDMLTRCEVMLEYLTEEVVLSLILLFYYQHLYLFIATIINSFLFCHESDPTFTKVSKVKEESELRPPHSVPLPFSDVSNNWSFYHYCLEKGV